MYMLAFESEKELINYLMTSDFSDEDFSPEDLIELLKKFRNYYRTKHSLVTRKDYEIAKLNKKITSYVNSMGVLEKELEMCEFRYERIKSKKLSLKERIKGKILE